MDACRSVAAGCAFAEVKLSIVDVGKALMPALDWLHIHRPNPSSRLTQCCYEVTAYESARPRHEHQLVHHSGNLLVRHRGRWLVIPGAIEPKKYGPTQHAFWDDLGAASRRFLEGGGRRARFWSLR